MKVDCACCYKQRISSSSKVKTVKIGTEEKSLKIRSDEWKKNRKFPLEVCLHLCLLITNRTVDT